MSNIEVEICTNQAELDEAFALRFDVFKNDYDQPAHELVDDVLDTHAMQLLARDENGSIVGTVRFQPYAQDLTKLERRPIIPISEGERMKLFDGFEGGRFGNLAVKPFARNKGVAATLIQFCEDYTKAHTKTDAPYIRFKSHYRIHPWYITKFGYTVDSEKLTSGSQDEVYLNEDAYRCVLLRKSMPC